MKTLTLGILFFLVGSVSSMGQSVPVENYLNNQYPLQRKAYVELPLGSIHPKGWLLEMLQRQKNGATGKMDELYPAVMGKRNGWLGGDGDQWERGPYWIDGLLPLAYILEDKKLINKTNEWIEWILNSQQPDGFFGPSVDYPNEPGVQRGNTRDWWPRMVVLKILQQYYSATQDERVIPFMSNYFRYQLKTLPEYPLGHWTFWAEFREADNLQAVYWLYNITREPFLLELADLLHKQGADFMGMYKRGDFKRICSIHCVNLAQGLKEPLIYYQQHPDPIYVEAVKGILKDIRQFHGQAQGMYGGDEALHGNNPTQGSELCSAVELMYSLEKMIEITGDVGFADHLEKIAFNALPTQISDDFMTRQYYQQPNQVQITWQRRNFDQDHEGTDVLFGLLTGYPCCSSNMHQGWPKFNNNLWYATPDNGLAAMVYSPSEVTGKVANGCQVTISEDTYYPMDEHVRFVIKDVDTKEKSVAFPLHLRIPGWCEKAVVRINDEEAQTVEGGKITVINRTWKENDSVLLELPMKVSTSTWYENSISVERGPLVYALKMNEKWIRKDTNNETYGSYYYDVVSDSPWNYGLVHFDRNKVNEHVRVVVNEDKQKNVFPWNVENAPISIYMDARRIPSWQLYNGMAGPVPYSVYGGAEGAVEEIELIPYGCTTLRISQFPVVWL